MLHLFKPQSFPRTCPWPLCRSTSGLNPISLLLDATSCATNLRPRGKGRKLAWQGALHENTMMLRMQMLPNVMPVATCRRCPGGMEPRPKCFFKPAVGGNTYEVSCDCQSIPFANQYHQYLAKARETSASRSKLSWYALLGRIGNISW